jgi:alpha-D-ribose 1-methylphosphonate 5-triphosphate synthase subunit PhnH
MALQARTNSAVAGAFADPVYQSQAVFRTVMDSMAHPGRVYPLPSACRPPAPLSATMGAILLTLADIDTPVWLDKALLGTPDAAAWIGFQTAAPVLDYAADAAFALISDASKLPALEQFGQGSQDYPDRSTTLLVSVASLSNDAGWVLRGPGIETVEMLQVVGLSSAQQDHFVSQWAGNHARFPRGVDVVFVADGAIASLPRSTSLSAEGN